MIGRLDVWGSLNQIEVIETPLVHAVANLVPFSIAGRRLLSFEAAFSFASHGRDIRH